MPQSEEQWKFIGHCEECGAACYAKDGEFKSTTNMDCLCWVKGYGDEDADNED